MLRRICLRAEGLAATETPGVESLSNCSSPAGGVHETNPTVHILLCDFWLWFGGERETASPAAKSSRFANETSGSRGRIQRQRSAGPYTGNRAKTAWTMATIRRQTDGGRYPTEKRSQGVDESQQRAPGPDGADWKRPAAERVDR